MWNEDSLHKTFKAADALYMLYRYLSLDVNERDDELERRWGITRSNISTIKNFSYNNVAINHLKASLEEEIERDDSYQKRMSLLSLKYISPKMKIMLIMSEEYSTNMDYPRLATLLSIIMEYIEYKTSVLLDQRTNEDYFKALHAIETNTYQLGQSVASFAEVIGTILELILSGDDEDLNTMLDRLIIKPTQREANSLYQNSVITENAEVNMPTQANIEQVEPIHTTNISQDLNDIENHQFVQEYNYEDLNRKLRATYGTFRGIPFQVTDVYEESDNVYIRVRFIDKTIPSLYGYSNSYLFSDEFIFDSPKLGFINIDSQAVYLTRAYLRSGDFRYKIAFHRFLLKHYAISYDTINHLNNNISDRLRIRQFTFEDQVKLNEVITKLFKPELRVYPNATVALDYLLKGKIFSVAISTDVALGLDTRVNRILLYYRQNKVGFYHTKEGLFVTNTNLYDKKISEAGIMFRLSKLQRG